MPTTTIKITPTRCLFNGGQFDSDLRYLRSTTASPRTTILAGPGIAVSLQSEYWVISWRFKCGSVNIAGPAEYGSPPSNVSNTPTEITL